MFKKKRKIRNYYLSSNQAKGSSKKFFKRKSSNKTSKRKSPLLKKTKNAFILITAILLAFFLIYGLFFSRYFNVKDIKVAEGDLENQTLSSEIIATTENILGKNIIFVDKKEVITKILNIFPEIQEIKIIKDHPSTVIIEFSEYPLAANIINESPSIKKSLIINSIGYVIKENLENTSLPYINLKSQEPINTENPAIEASKLKYILDTITYFEDKFGMRIIEVEYKKTPRELHLLTEKNFSIWLDMQQPSENQLKKLKKSLVKLDIFNEPLEYIDLRIAGGNGDKIIYKRRPN